LLRSLRKTALYARHRVAGAFQTERYVPVSPSAAFAALVSAVSNDSRLKNATQDDFTLTVRFASRAAGRSWGQDFVAYVVSSNEGSMICIEGVGKVSIDRVNAKKMQQHSERILSYVTAVLRNAAAAGNGA
jgi:mevalonate pyrophosphate decarboxylase